MIIPIKVTVFFPSITLTKPHTSRRKELILGLISYNFSPSRDKWWLFQQVPSSLVWGFWRFSSKFSGACQSNRATTQNTGPLNTNSNDEFKEQFQSESQFLGTQRPLSPLFSVNSKNLYYIKYIRISTN